jgi:predicted nucleic acid-binding protein
VRILFDTNVVLDLLLDREPWSETAAELFAWVDTGDIEGLLGATTVTTLHYLAAKVTGAAQARQEIRKLLGLFNVAPVNRSVLSAAIDLEMSDFEDAVLYEAARQAGAEGIVTRNERDFRGVGELMILDPRELAKSLEQRGGIGIESVSPATTKDILDAIQDSRTGKQ